MQKVRYVISILIVILGCIPIFAIHKKMRTDDNPQIRKLSYIGTIVTVVVTGVVLVVLYFYSRYAT